MVDIIRRLVNLKELAVDERRLKLDEETFSEIVSVVKGRPNALTLKCEFSFNLKSDEKQMVKLLRHHLIE